MEQQEKSKDVDECFTCDCGTHDHCMIVTLMGDQMAIFNLSEQRWINRPWYERLIGGVKQFWQVFWHKTVEVEIVLNRREHKKFKAFMSQLQDERCWDCDHGYAAARAHAHEAIK